MIDPRSPDYAATPAAPTRPRFGYAPTASSRPVVTVVTPFFNAGPVFAETAACILGQSLQAFEWIIVNDGSTDAASLDMLAPWRNADPRIRVIDHPGNRGLAAARNTGFRAALAPFVFQLDADDLIEPTTLEKCAWFLETHPEFAFVKGFSVGFGAQRYLWTRGFHSGAQVLCDNPLTATALIRRSVFDDLGGYDESLRAGLEDWDFWLRAAARGHWGATIPEFLDWYRRRERAPGEWADLQDEQRRREFLARATRASPGLARGRFPAPAPRSPDDSPVRIEPPWANPLQKRAPRLLMIVPWLTLGGADRFNLDLVGRLSAQGWEVSIVTTLPGDHTWLPEFTRLTPDIFALHHFLRPRDIPAFLRALIESRRPDAVLVSNSELGYGLLDFLRAACPGPAYLDYCHMEEEEWKSGGFPRMSLGHQGSLDLSIVASDHLRGWMIERGAAGAKVEVCRINADPGHWSPDPGLRAAERARLNLPDQTPVILYAARLCPQKQPRILAQTALNLVRAGADFRLLVAGDGPDLPWLERFITRHALEQRIILLGPVPMSGMRPLMAASDVFFLPSRWEGIALSIYEAMSMGLAIVGAAVGGQRELVTPGCGLLLDIPRHGGDGAPDSAGHDADSIQAAGYAESLLALLADPAQRAAMGSAARQRIQAHFTLDAMGRRMDELLRRAIALHATDPRTINPAASAAGAAQRAITRACLDWGPGRAQWLALQRAGAGVDRHAADTLLALARIENSRAWRLVERARRLLTLADDAHSHATPAQRLARIEASRAYRLIGAAKRSAPYRLYARRRYGPHFEPVTPAPARSSRPSQFNAPPR